MHALKGLAHAKITKTFLIFFQWVQNLGTPPNPSPTVHKKTQPFHHGMHMLAIVSRAVSDRQALHGALDEDLLQQAQLALQ
jgi:hypothetical protein